MITWLALLLVAHQAHAGALECDLHPSTFNSALDPFAPHTQDKRDLNGDGVDDFFYLAGTPGGAVATCIFFGSKTNEGQTLKLVHRDANFLDTFGDFGEAGRPELLIPEKFEVCGPDNGIALIPKRLDKEIEKAYANWTNGMQGMLYKPKARAATANLYLLNPVHLYYFEGAKKIDVTADAKTFMELKKKVLRETLKNPALTTPCQTALHYGLRRLEQYTETWAPMTVGLSTEDCIAKTKFNLGKLKPEYVTFNDDCSKAYVAHGEPKIDVLNATITGMLGIAGICNEHVTSEVRLQFSDGADEVLKTLSGLNPGRPLTLDPRADGMQVSFAAKVPNSDLVFKTLKAEAQPKADKRLMVWVKGTTEAVLSWTSTPTCPRLPMMTSYRTDASAKQRLIDLIKQENEMAFKF